VNVRVNNLFLIFMREEINILVETGPGMASWWQAMDLEEGKG
jgi:hypothetical protein